MSKTVINNNVEPEWTPVIENSVQIMLGSMMGNLNRIDVELDRIRPRPRSHLTYSCKLMLTDGVGEKFLLYNDQPDARLAIEGAVARARRAVNRAARARRHGWQKLSQQ